MEEQTNARNRRRKRSQLDLFKEACLPYIILAMATLLIVIFIIGALVRNAKDTPEPPQKQDTSTISAFVMGDQL